MTGVVSVAGGGGFGIGSGVTSGAGPGAGAGAGAGGAVAMVGGTTHETVLHALAKRDKAINMTRRILRVYSLMSTASL